MGKHDWEAVRHMDAVEIARELAGGGRVHELAGDHYRLFRIWSGSSTSLVKVYASESWARREERALNALATVQGLPKVLDRGSTDGSSWLRFEDPGMWNLATLPESAPGALQAGQILRSLHDADPSALTNLSGGITPEKIETEYRATFERLERYRGRLGMRRDIIDRALAAPLPRSSSPRATHSNPRPEKFLVADGGQVTLVDWGWATVAPPEWDYSLAWWSFRIGVGDRSVAKISEGYGAALSDASLQPWVVYHVGTHLLRIAETQSGRLEQLEPIVNELGAFLSA